MDKTYQLPITVTLAKNPVSVMPVQMRVDFSLMFPDVRVLDLYSLRMFEINPDGERTRIPVQCSLDERQATSGMLTWMAPRHQMDSLKRDFILEVNSGDMARGVVNPKIEGPYFPAKFFDDERNAKLREYFLDVQAVPWSDDKISFQVDGREMLVYNYSPNCPKSYFFPVIGPAGRCLTRIGHPYDPDGHSHHHSLWIAHPDVNGVNFWGEGENCGQQVHYEFGPLEDGPVYARMVSKVHWISPSRNIVVDETRDVKVYAADGNQMLIDFVLTFRPVSKPVIFNKTNFALLAIRMAKPITVFDGSGRIRNSDGARNEVEIFWTRAKWCDYSGLITQSEWNGIAIFDHPDNYGHPACWHVRNDGWMCPSPVFESPMRLSVGDEWTLKYRLFVHAGDVEAARVEERYAEYVIEKKIEI